MGLLVNGEWRDVWYDTKSNDGRFERQEAGFRNWVTADGEPGPAGEGGFKAEPGRYHLYVSLACPWAHRTLIFRLLKKLEDVISVSVVDPFMGENGWAFSAPDGSITSGSTRDDLFGARYLHEIYTRARRDYTGRVTVPVLWDRERATIVNNESSEIIRMLNSAFDQFADASINLYPRELRDEIDAINAKVYANVNNGVYRCGFATTQAAYDEAFAVLFATVDELEARLSSQRYLAGSRLTEADWRLFTTLVRFDSVYYAHFKCNLRRIIDYPNLWNYTRELFQIDGVAETVSIAQIKRHYYASHAQINPTRIVPDGPLVDFNAPHDRARLPANPMSSR
jgi:putative glutathione S-transferase